MREDANQPEVVPVPAYEATRPPAGRREAFLIALGAGIGLAVGVAVMIGMSAIFSFMAPPFLSPIESVRVFNEINELRQQLNEINEQAKLKDLDKDATLRQALSTVQATARASNRPAPVAIPAGNQTAGKAEEPRVARPNDPFAEIDAEVKRLEQTQQVLNTMLDMLTSKRKERPKEH
jgi:hypothetical protein